MKLSKKFKPKNNRNLISLTKLKIINKSFQNDSNIIARKKLSTNITNTKKINKKNDFLLKRFNKNNITINNSINNIINNIIITNHPLEKKPKYTTANNSKSKKAHHPFVRKRNTKTNFLSLMKEHGISRNKTINNSKHSNNSFLNFMSYFNKIGKEPSFTINKLKNENLVKYKRNKYIDLTNNKSLYNNSINNSIKETFKKNVNISLKTINFEGSLRNKLYRAGKDKLKEKELEKKIKNAILGTNKNIHPIKRLNNIKKEKKIEFNKINKLNLNKNNLINSSNLGINKNKTLNDLFVKRLKYKNINSNNNKTNININNNHEIPNYKKFNEKNKKINSFYNIIFKDGKNEKSFKIAKKNIENKSELENDEKELNKSIINQNKIEKIKNNDLSVNNTIKFSKSTMKTEVEGELGLDEVQDIIIYYKLNKEINKDYLFKKNDYIEFLQKRKKRYLRFFIK